MRKDCISPSLGTPPKRQRVQGSPASVVTPSAALLKAGPLTKSDSVASNLSSASSSIS